MSDTKEKLETTDDKPKLQLVGTDGNAFAILGKARKAGKRAGWSKEKVNEVLEEAKSGDYDHLLQTVMIHFDVS